MHTLAVVQALVLALVVVLVAVLVCARKAGRQCLRHAHGAAPAASRPAPRSHLTSARLVPPVARPRCSLRKQIPMPRPVCRRRVIPYAVADFFPIYVLFNVLLGALYAMQLMWMRGIARVLRWVGGCKLGCGRVVGAGG